MKGRALIDYLRNPLCETAANCGYLILLADAVEIADDACRTTIETECSRWPDGIYFAGQPTHLHTWWFDTAEVEPYVKPHIARALSYLGRRDLIERKEGEPHLVRFVEEAQPGDHYGA